MIAEPATLAPPNSLQAEQCVLGSMLIEARACDVAAARLSPPDFYRDAHRILFGILAEMHSDGRAIDFMTVAQRVEAEGFADAITPAYLVQLTDAVPGTAASVGSYADIVAEMAERRRLIEAADITHALAHRVDAPIGSVIEQAHSALMAATDPLHAGTSARTASEWAADLLDEIEQRSEHRASSGYLTGYAAIDRSTDGLMPAQLSVLAARPSVGKTALAQRIAIHIAEQGGPVLFMSLDTAAKKLISRMAAQIAHADVLLLDRGGLPTEESRRAGDAICHIANLPLLIDETSLCSVLHVRLQARRARVQFGRLALVVVDYVQQMSGDETSQGSRHLELSDITRRLKGIGRELNAHVMVLSQLSRNIEQRPDHKPKLSDLRDSGGLEAEADLVMALHRPAVYADNDTPQDAVQPTSLHILKHKNGPTGVEKLVFLPRWAGYEDAE